MTDKTGWILRSVDWRKISVEGKRRRYTLDDGDELYLVLGPVPAKTTPHSWTLLDMRTGKRKTVPADDLDSVLLYRRLA